MTKTYKGGYIGGSDQLRAPDAPTISVSGGEGEVTVTFTNPANTGGGDISSYTATAIASNVSTGATSSSSPITITGLTNGTSYSVTGLANNAFGTSPISSATTGSPAATKALILSGYGTISSSLATHNIIQVVTISSAGDSTDWGADLVDGRHSGGCCSSSTRGIIGGGLNTDTTVDQTVIQYVTIASAANAQDFGDLGTGGYDIGGCSNSTYGFFCGGMAVSTIINTIQRIVIASTGNVSDHGDLTETAKDPACFSDGTYGFRAGGAVTVLGNNSDVIDRFIMASSGNASDFGDLLSSREDLCTQSNACSSTRAIVAGGGYSNVIEYITMASAANAADFGDLRGNYTRQFGTSNSTRAIFGGGAWDGSGVQCNNQIDYITIASTGNAADFGSLLGTMQYAGGVVSNGHGGLS